MNIFLKTDRIRAIADACRTEKDLSDAMRAAKIRASWTTETGFLSMAVPVRTGKVYIYRTASRSHPFRVIHSGRSGTPFGSRSRL